MEKLIEIIFCIFIEIICIKILIHDRKEDRINDLKYKLEDRFNYKNIPCTEKSEHCDYCGTDSCIYHPNND
jgi:hypothetical protein